MKNRIQLYQLIHKLSKSEKRAFKIYISKYKSEKDQKIAQLFDLLNKMSEYDEAKLLEVFSKSQLNYHLHKLKNFLLNALSDIHFKNNDESIGEIIHRIELGFKYNEFDIIEDNLKKGLELAEQDNNVALKLYLLKHLQSLNTERKDLVKFIETDKKIIEEIDFLSRETYYGLLWGEVTYWSSQNRNKKEITPLKFSDPKLADIFDAPLDEKGSFKEQGQFLHAKSLFIETTDPDNQQAVLQIEELLYKLYLTHKKPISRDALKNLILTYFRLGKLKEAEEKISQAGIFEKHKKNDFPLNENSFLDVTILSWYFFYKKEYDSILSMESIYKKLFQAPLNQLIGIDLASSYQQMIIIFIVVLFKRKQYNQCLNWLLKIKERESGQTKSQPVISTILQFLEFFAHLELNNDKILPSLLNGIQYSVNVKKSHTSKLEKELIRIAKAISKKKVFQIDKNLFEIRPFGYYQYFFSYLEEKQKELDK